MRYIPFLAATAAMTTMPALAAGTNSAPVEDDTRILILIGLFLFGLVAFAWIASKVMPKGHGERDDDEYPLPIGIDGDDPGR